MEEPSVMKYNCDVRYLRSWGVEWEPLNQRAWVMQERQLSSRIMHFSKWQTFWECRETFTSENHIASLPSWTQPSWTADTLRLKKIMFDLVHRGKGMSSKSGVHDMANSNLSKEAKDSLYYQWCAFRIKYTSCDLTKDGDKLVALKGLADLIAKPLEDELVAGLWKDRISQELCWFVNSSFGRSTTPEPVEWRAPTWSWACSNALIWVSNTTKFLLRHESMSYLIRVLAISVDEERSGALRSASLQVECRPLLTGLRFLDYDKLRNKDLWEEGVVLEVERSGLELTSDRVPSDVTVAMDKSDYRPLLRASLIIIQYCDHGGEVDSTSDTEVTEGTCLEGLILVPSESNGTFERIGLFTITSDRLVAQMMEEHRHTEMKVITLI